MKSFVLRRFAPLLMLTPLALAHCGGSDNSDLDLDGDGGLPRDSGRGTSSDASDAATVEGGGPSPTCPDFIPAEGQACVGKSQVCMYGDRLCVCSSGVPWTCFDIVDAGSSPDAAGRPDGRTDGGAADTRQDAGSSADVRVDAGRDAVVDPPIDTRVDARDTGTDRDVNTRDAVDARVDVRDVRRDLTPDTSADRSSDAAPSDDVSPDSDDDAPVDDAGDEGGD